jgi:WD40 repeat protein
VISGGHDGTVRLWRPKEASRVLQKRRGAVLALAVSPDGKPGGLGGASPPTLLLAAGGFNGVITLLDVSAGKERARLTGHKTWVNSLAFSSDGARLASGSSDGTARLWDVKTSTLIRVFALPDPREIRGVAQSPDGKTLAAGVRFGQVKAWDATTGKEVASLDAHEGDAWSVAFTPDGKTLISGGGDWGRPGRVRLWNTATWTARATLAHTAEVLCVAVSADGRWLAAGGADRAVRLWDLRPPKK